MRQARGALSIGDVTALTGVARGEISMFERGHSIPNARQVAALEPVYGPATAWYPAGVLAVLLADLGICEGCDGELAPDSSRRRRYHNPACAARARRRRLKWAN